MGSGRYAAWEDLDAEQKIVVLELNTFVDQTRLKMRMMGDGWAS